MRSIQGRIIAIFFALILLAMQFIGVYLLRALEKSYLTSEQEKRIYEAQLLAGDIASFLVQRDSLEDQDRESSPEAQIQQLLEEFNRGRYYTHVMVIDRDGTVIAAADPALIGQRTLQEAAALQALETAQVRPYQRLDPYSGGRQLGAAAPVLGPEGQSLGVTLVEGDFSVIEATLQGIRRILFSATIVVATMAVVLAWITSRTITGPIRAITTRAARMAAGDFEQRIEVRSQDELGQLAEMFNYLATRLKETLDEISTEKHKVEAILSHMTDGVVAFDQNGRIFMANPAARRMLGLNGVDLETHAAAAIGESLWKEWQAAAAKKERGPVIIKRGERSFSVYFASIPAVGQKGAAGTVCVLHDVTELEQLETLRREFVANVSHELRTPLTAIKSYSETLLNDKDIPPDVRQSFLQVIHDETDRMARLVRDLLDLSQLESQRAAWDYEYCRISELAKQVMKSLQPQFQGKGLRVEMRQQGETPEPLIYADPDRIQQVLLNLLSNAVEFTPQGGSIEVIIESRPAEIMVMISDSGVGIPKEDLPRIFDRFYRVDKARTRTMGGTGLGLAIARQIIEAHGGKIGIESELGKGTTIWFTVPYEKVDLAV